MKLTKTLLSLCIGSTLLLTAGSTLAQTLRAADVHPADYPNVVAVKHMGEKLSSATQGRLDIKTFPGGVLGDEKQMIEQAQLGAIDIIRVSMARLPPFCQKLTSSPCRISSATKTICTRCWTA